jgi:hypothetical protein
VAKKTGNGNLKATISSTDYDREKVTGESGMLQIYG